MTKAIVIAHYKEDLSWIEEINDVKIYLYTKGDIDIDLAFKDNLIIEKLNNIGNEQHTYLYHIIKYYEKLEDIIYFIQANPFEHSHNFLEKLSNNYIGGISDFNLITTLYGDVDRAVYKKHINHKYVNVSINDIIGNVFIDPWNDQNAINNLGFLIDELSELEIKKENWIFNANGMYSSRKERLMKFEKSFYIKCIETFKCENLKMLAFAFERIGNFIYL